MPVRILLLICLLFNTLAVKAAQKSIPEVLKPWVPWVQKGHEYIDCPFINQTPFGQPQNHLCAWPSALTLDAKDNGGYFEQNWQVMSDSWLPLPGDRDNWPQQVKANDKAQVVVERYGKPMLRLGKGNYRVKGRFLWSKLPESLSVPDSYAFVEMSVNGKTVAFPRLESGELWLSELQVDKSENDSATVEVYRLLTDGAYIRLTTQIQLEVSGKRREQAIGRVLPDGFSLTNITGDISAYLDAQGILHAKLKPGSWTLTVNSWAGPTQQNWQHSGEAAIWPKQEVWAFAADENFRAGKIEGGRIIDSAQTDMPSHWRAFPSYLLNPGEGLSYLVGKRGKSQQKENQLQLHRQLWLGFEGMQYTFVDSISGKMTDHWRLSMNPPFTLESATDDDGPMLITSQSDNERGIENRYYDVSLEARGTVDKSSEMPVSGWDSHFENVSLELNLPPSYRLFAVFGADEATHTWLGQWSIWTAFVVLFCAILTTRFMGVVLGSLTAVTMVVIFQERSAPIMLMVNLLVGIVAAKHQPFEQLKIAMRVYLGFSVLAFAGAALLFSANQLRTTVHPQLESKQVSYNDRQRLQAFNNSGVAYDQLSEARQERAEPAIERMKVKSVPPDMSAVSLLSPGTKTSDPIERYESNAVMQAGPGIPNWRWNQHHIHWTSPVAKQQQVSIVIQPAWVTRILKVLGVALLLLWTVLLFKDNLKSLLFRPAVKTAVAAFTALVLIPLGSEQAQAADIPDKNMLEALQQRILEAPQCNPQCATISQTSITATEQMVTLDMQLHVLEDTAIALPESRFWRAQKVQVNEQLQNALFRHQGWTYIPLNKGIHQVRLSGIVAPVEQLQLQFKDLPKRVDIKPSPRWDIIGVSQARLSGNSVTFVSKRQQIQGTSKNSRYTATPYVQVTREISFDLIWKVKTTVIRIAPSKGSITMKIPLLPQERVTTGNLVIDNNQVEVAFSADNRQNAISWNSTLPSTPTLTLVADESLSATQHWQISSSPSWHVKQSGLPMVEQRQAEYATANYYPYPGESLTLEISRPKAVAGQMLAIDQVNAKLDQGERTAVYQLDFNYRATRGGEHTIELPRDFQLKQVMSDDKTLNIQSENGSLTLPVSPGEHKVSIELRATQPSETMLKMPHIDLNASLSNITMKMDLTKTRWILFADGPVTGPAIVYWGELLVFLLLAVLLSRYRFSPLNTAAWLALGFGLSLYSWWILMAMVVWFGALTLARHRSQEISDNLYNLSQIALYFLSFSTLYHLVMSIPGSLLGHPDMGIRGNYTYDSTLSWFADKSAGVLPEISVLNIPVLFYKGVMLLWVLWLSFALISWCKWAWQALGEQGYWRKTQKNIENNPESEKNSKNSEEENKG